MNESSNAVVDRVVGLSCRSVRPVLDYLGF